MKLAKVKVAYTCGLTIVETVSVDTTSGELFLPQRLTALMASMEKWECRPVFTLDYGGYPLPVRCDAASRYSVTLPSEGGSVLRQFLDSIAYPTEVQRQQNGRLIHTLSAAAIVSAAATLHGAQAFSWSLLGSFALQAGGAVLLWYVGFLCLKGD